jgi:leucyl aminopeptidase
MTTLTGAARIALGTELPALFSNNDELANALLAQAEQQYDPLWRMPLFSLYRDSINSTIADINNNSSDGYGGAITAALFLKEFVPDTIPWVHLDLMAWNTKTRPGRPQGGEAMGLRALFSYLTGFSCAISPTST